MDLWLTLLPILLSDVVNPVLFAYMVYAAGTKRPVTASSVVLLGHTTAYLTAGIVLALGLEKISSRLANPEPFDFVIELVIGSVLLVLAVVSATSAPETKKPDTPRTEDLSIGRAFVTGAVINFIGLPFAVPYFAAIDQILKANLTPVHSIGVLVAYNVAYAIPFVAVPLAAALLGERSRPYLEKVNQILDRISGFLIPLLLGGVGAALVADAAHYFIQGEPLF